MSELNKNPVRVNWLDVMVTERCNFNCVYCFHHQMPKDMTMETLNNMIDHFLPLFDDYVVINYFGGEPLLRLDFLKESAKVLRERVKGAIFNISTNLALYNNEVAEFAKEYMKKGSFQISYDGIDQERHRGSSELVRENIKKCIADIGVDMTCVRLTFTKDTIEHLYDNMVDIYNLGLRYVMHSCDFTPEWTQEHSDAYEKQLEKMYEFSNSHPGFTIKFADCQLAVAKREKTRCSMGRELMTISADGRVFPCHRAVAHPELEVGNVNTKHLNRGGFITLTCNSCDSCSANNICHNCLIAAYNYTKTMRVPLPVVCAINKIEYKAAVKEYKKNFPEEAYERSMFPKMIDVLTDIRNVRSKTITLLEGVKNGR